MKQKDTEELLDIWKRNDREEWAEIGFEVIYDILTKRLGSVPDQGVDEKAQEEGLVDEEPEIYHDPDVLVRISALARSAAWVVLVASIVIWLSQVVGYISSFTSSPIPGAGLAEIVMITLGSGFTLITGVLYFIVLRFVSEVVYILMDIEENTRVAETLIESNQRTQAQSKAAII